jgi:hypothetical protein
LKNNRLFMARFSKKKEPKRIPFLNVNKNHLLGDQFSYL